MSEIIERIARALCKGRGFDPDEILSDFPTTFLAWMDYIPDARTAIEAMREPSKSMIEAAVYSLANVDVSRTETDMVKALLSLWRAMNDAALGSEG